MIALSPVSYYKYATFLTVYLQKKHVRTTSIKRKGNKSRNAKIGSNSILLSSNTVMYLSPNSVQYSPICSLRSPSRSCQLPTAQALPRQTAQLSYGRQLQCTYNEAIYIRWNRRDYQLITVLAALTSPSGHSVFSCCVRDRAYDKEITFLKKTVKKTSNALA